MIAIKIYRYPELDNSIITETYSLYVTSFTPLLKTAVQNHMISYVEFEKLWWNHGIEKHLVYVDGNLAGISVVTNKLYQWPLISAEYFEHNYPRYFHEDEIWYVGFVCVAEKYHNSGAFKSMLESMINQRTDCLFFMDFCKTNIDRKIVLLCTRALLQLNDSVKMEQEDVQEFWKVSW